MIIKKLFVLFLIFSAGLSFKAQAFPKNFEVWFISPATTAFIKLPQNIKQYRSLAFAKQCQKYGEYCFDPQIGLYDPKDKEAKQIKVDNEKVEHKKVETITDSSLINCEKGNYFDIYCGKARKTKQVQRSLEIWVDTSSSLRSIDPEDSSGGCRRRSFVTAIEKTCGNAKVDFYSFDTSKRYTTAKDRFCLNHGLNDQKRIMNWIADSTAKNLIIITDISEYTAKLDDFITKNGGHTRGTDVEEVVTSEKMMELVASVSNYCK